MAQTHTHIPLSAFQHWMCIAFLAILTVHPLPAQPDFYGFSKIPLTTTFNTNDYDGGIQNWGISEDRNGFIYVANNFGLLEYDGKTWRKYEVENNTRLRSVYIDVDNKIYIGGQNQFGYFEPNEKGQLIFHSLKGLLDKGEAQLEDVWKIIKFENKILFCSYQGIIAYDGQVVTSLPHTENYDLTFRVSNRLFCQSMGQGLLEWNGQAFSFIAGSAVMNESPVSAILPHRSNSLLVFQKNGHIFSHSQGSFHEWALDVSDFLKFSGINTALLLKNNNIAIGTQNNGLVILSPEGKTLMHLTKGRGINNRTILSLYEDQFSNLWVGMNNGISIVEIASPFSLIDEQSGLPGTGYGAALHHGKLYLGTSNGLFYQSVNPDPISAGQDKYKLVKNTSGQVYNIQSFNGEVLLAHHNGAYQVIDDQAEPFFTETGAWKFEKPANDLLLAGTYDGFRLFRKSNGKYNLISRIDGFSESSRVFEFVTDSSLFMTHGYKGAYKIDFSPSMDNIKEVGFFGVDSGFPSNILINVFKIDNQLVFAAEYGLFGYDAASNKIFHHKKLEKHLGADTHIRELTQDLSGKIYFFSTKELGYLEQTPYGDYEKRGTAFSRIANLLSDDLENITVIDHENVILGAKEGFVHFNPSANVSRTQPFKTFIRSIEATIDQDETLYAGNGEMMPTSSISFPAFFPSLRFKFASPYFNGQESLLYQYQLENFDKEWSDWSPMSEKEYTNLAQGSYRFKVRAQNVFGDISEPAYFPFKVFPPWYRSRIAYALYGLFTLVIFGLVLFLLDKRHENEKKKLTLTQKRELIKKDNEIVEVAKKSSEEINKLRNDKLRAEIDHKNRELATTTMHLITKNEFMLTVREGIMAFSKSGSKDAIRKIVKDIDRNLSEDEGWEQFTRHFDQVHGNFLTNLKKQHPTLTPQEIKLCAYLRMNMTSKEIANLLNISVRGVEISRYRLRKKLDINRDTNLIDFMLEYS